MLGLLDWAESEGLASDARPQVMGSPWSGNECAHLSAERDEFSERKRSGRFRYGEVYHSNGEKVGGCA